MPAHENKVLLQVLDFARGQTQAMIRHRATHPALGRPPRDLDAEEMEILQDAEGRLGKAHTLVSSAVRKTDVDLSAICGSEPMIRRLKMAKIATVGDMIDFTPPVLLGILEQCKGIGSKGQHHMHFLIHTL